MRIIKKNENVGTRPRGSKLTKFPYILSCKMRPKKFTDRNIFYAGYEKSEIKKKKTPQDFDQGTLIIQTASSAI